jgi:hypothetical protein
MKKVVILLVLGMVLVGMTATAIQGPEDYKPQGNEHGDEQNEGDDTPGTYGPHPVEGNHEEQAQNWDESEP